MPYRTWCALPVVLAALLWGGAGFADDPPVSDILSTGKKLYSQFDEELIIRDFFQDKRGGVFLDVGASYPIENSTTYYLEHHLGWSGVGIDALPEYAAQYAEKRPRTLYRNYIVTDHSGTIEKFYRVKGAPGLSSTLPDRVFRGKKVESETIEIPTITLNELLDEAGIAKIDFLSMDIEGGAPKALAGFDIERFQPALVCIESAGPVEGHSESVLAYFEEHGYELIERYRERDKMNWYFQREG